MRIAVLRGGPSPDYEHSLETGRVALGALRDNFPVADILIDNRGVWHERGAPVAPERILARADVVMNALHGDWGEDGRLSRLLESLRVKHTGHGAFASAAAYVKNLAKDLLTRAGLRTPKGFVVESSDELGVVSARAFREFGGRYVIKPVVGSMSRGFRVVRSQPELGPALIESVGRYPRVLLEEFIMGKEIKCGVIKSFRGQPFYALLPAEVENSVRPYHHETHRLIIPARLSREEKDLIMDTAVRAHQALNLRPYSSVDMILTRRGQPVVLEVDALPLLGAGHHFSQALSAVGSSPAEFLTHLVTSV